MYRLISSLFLVALASSAAAQKIIIYDDELQSGFFDLSFPAFNIIDLEFKGSTAAGDNAIFAALAPFGGLRFVFSLLYRFNHRELCSIYFLTF